MSVPDELKKLPERWRINAAKCESIAKANVLDDDGWLWTEGCEETYRRCADELDEMMNGFRVIGEVDV